MIVPEEISDSVSCGIADATPVPVGVIPSVSEGSLVRHAWPATRTGQKIPRHLPAFGGLPAPRGDTLADGGFTPLAAPHVVLPEHFADAIERNRLDRTAA